METEETTYNLDQMRLVALSALLLGAGLVCTGYSAGLAYLRFSNKRRQKKITKEMAEWENQKKALK